MIWVIVGMLVRSISIAGIFLSVATAALGETRQFGNVVYDVPEGWNPGANSDGKQILISDLPDDRCDYCYIYIGSPVQETGAIDDFLKNHRYRFIDEEDRADARPMGDPVYFDLRGKEAGMLATLADGKLHMFAAVALTDRFETFGFEGSADDEALLAETMDVFQNQFAPMIERATYVSEGGKSLLPDAIPGDLSGLWWGTETAWPLGLDGMMHMEIYHTHLMFWPDGYFYRGTPPQGTAALNRTALLETANTEFGVYVHTGNTLTLTYADGATDTATIDGTSITLGSTTAYPVELLPDGQMIEGTISSVSYMGFTPGSGVTGGVSSANSTTFHKNGTYEGESSGGAFGNFESGGDYTGGFSTGSENSTGGTYEIRDGLIVSTPNDGSGQRADLIFRSGKDILIGERFLE